MIDDPHGNLGTIAAARAGAAERRPSPSSVPWPFRCFRSLTEPVPRRAATRARALVRFVVAGDGPSMRELVSLADGLALGSAVEFLGNRDDADRLLAGADVFVLPSRAEGMSNALLEAMAAGLPVVASAVAGNTDVIDHEVNGFLVEPDDPASLAAALSRLIDEPDLRDRLGRAARATIEARYTMARVADRYVSLYRNLLSSRHTSRRRPGAVARLRRNGHVSSGTPT